MRQEWTPFQASNGAAGGPQSGARRPSLNGRDEAGELGLRVLVVRISRRTPTSFAWCMHTHGQSDPVLRLALRPARMNRLSSDPFMSSAGMANRPDWTYGTRQPSAADPWTPWRW